MKSMRGTVGNSMGIIALSIYIGIVVGLFALSVYGIYLAFCASIILGVIVLFTPPSGAVVGAVMFFFGKDLAFMLVEFLTK